MNQKEEVEQFEVKQETIDKQGRQKKTRKPAKRKKPKHDKSDTNCLFCGVRARTQSMKKHQLYCPMKQSWEIMESKNAKPENTIMFIPIGSTTNTIPFVDLYMNFINYLCGDCIFGCLPESIDIDATIRLLRSLKWFKKETSVVHIIPVFIVTLEESKALMATRCIVKYFENGKLFGDYDFPLVLIDLWFVEKEEEIEKVTNSIFCGSIIEIVCGASIFKRIEKVKQIIQLSGIYSIVKERLIFGGLSRFHIESGFSSQLPDPCRRQMGINHVFPRKKIITNEFNIRNGTKNMVEKSMCFYCGEFHTFSNLSRHEDSCDYRYIQESQMINMVVLIPLDEVGLTRARLFGKSIPFENTFVSVVTLPLYKATFPPRVLSLIRNHLGKWNNGMIQQYLWQEHLNYLADMHPYTKIHSGVYFDWLLVKAVFFGNHKQIMKPIHLPDTATCFYSLQMDIDEWDDQKPLFHPKWEKMQLCRTVYFSNEFRYLESIPLMLSLFGMSKKRKDWHPPKSVTEVIEIDNDILWPGSSNFPYLLLNALFLKCESSDIEILFSDQPQTSVETVTKYLIEKNPVLKESQFEEIQKNVELWLRALDINVNCHHILKNDIIRVASVIKNQIDDKSKSAYKLHRNKLVFQTKKACKEYRNKRAKTLKSIQKNQGEKRKGEKIIKAKMNMMRYYHPLMHSDKELILPTTQLFRPIQNTPNSSSSSSTTLKAPTANKKYQVVEVREEEEEEESDEEDEEEDEEDEEGDD